MIGGCVRGNADASESMSEPKSKPSRFLEKVQLTDDSDGWRHIPLCLAARDEIQQSVRAHAAKTLRRNILAHSGHPPQLSGCGEDGCAMEVHKLLGHTPK